LELIFPFAVALIWMLLCKLLCSKKQNLNGNVVLITGGGMGIGREMALKFAARGCSIVLWDICKDNVDKVANEIRALHSNTIGVHCFQCDVSSEDAVKVAASNTLASVGQVDILVNNAGIVSGRSILDLDSAQISRTFGVNTFAHYWTVRAFLPSMIACRQGHIVNIASIMGMMGSAGLTDYCGSKFAAVGLTHSLRMELIKHNRANPGTDLGCTLICPFMINTGMFDGTTVRFFPVLEPKDVAERVVRACEYREKVVVMPSNIHWVESLLHLFPPGVMDLVALMSGGVDGMDHFKGRGATPAPTPTPAPTSSPVRNRSASVNVSRASTPVKTKSTAPTATPKPAASKAKTSTKAQRAASPSPAKVTETPALRRTTRKAAPSRRNAA